METDSTLAPSPAAPGSDASKKYFGNLRADVKARLFAQAGETSGPDGSVSPPIDPLATPNRIGRYVVIKRIGAGGMGLVYAAYDDKLDRRVAVKLLRPGHRTTGGRAQERLLREAQAIARLSHRCVIQVYEVGTHEDEVFVAMEYVDGPTLKQWQPSRDWRDILQRYRDAGLGLCAAHEAGIVHRDFKADNVLVRPSDLTVRVLDFGLARTEDLDDTTSTEPSTSAATSLTHTGMVMGTPAYMAPEQHLALPTDTRTDQFSYCASLFEALYGFRAFAGETLDELRKNVLDGHIEPAPHYTKVPPSVHRALQRGLCVEPDARFPTMEALLAELEVAEPRRPWARAAWGLGIATALAAGGMVWTSANATEVAADAERLRTEFDSARRADAEDELRRLEARTLPERWNDLVLAYARAAPGATAALASLKHLTTSSNAWLPAARALANDAHRRGPVFATLALPSPAVRIAFGGNDALAVQLDDGSLRRWADPAQDGATTLSVQGTVVDLALDETGTLHVAQADGRIASFAPDATRAEVRAVADVPLTALACDRRTTCAAGTNDGRVLVFAGEQTQTLREHTGAITSLAFDPKTQTLASGDTGGGVVAWFLDRDTHRTFDADVRIDAVAWPDSQPVLLGLTANGPIAWAPATGWPTTTEVPTDTRTLDSTEGVQVLHRRERVWLQFDDETQTPLDCSERTTTVAMSPSGTWVAGADPAGVTLWRASTDTSGTRATGDRVVDLGDRGRVTSLHAHGTALYGITDAGLLFSIDANDHVETLAELGSETDGGEASPDGHHIALENAAGTLYVIDLDAPAQPRRLGQLEGPQPGPLAWSADGTAIAKLSCEGYERQCTASVHPLDGSAPVVLGSTEAGPTMLRLATDAKAVAVLGPSGVSIWDVDTKQPARFDHPRLARGSRVEPLAMDLHDGAVRLAAFDVHERSLTLRVWTMGDQTPAVPLFEESNLRGGAPTSDGRGVVLHTTDGRQLLWLLAEDRFRLLPDGALGSLTLETRIHRSPMGTHLWVVHADPAHARVIDLNTGQMQRVPRPVAPTAWASDGSWADVVRLRHVRRWAIVPPQTPEAFLAWLDRRTRVTMPLEALHASVAPTPDPL